MKCYNHPERDGVAICMACGRALCHECFRETETGIGCRDKCTDLLERNKKLSAGLEAYLKNAKRNVFLSAFFSMGMGILFIVFSNMGFGIVYDFILILGTGFILYGFVALLANMIIFFKQRGEGKP